MINNPDDVALSEVIGFVLILALITVAFSLYLVYGVPAQGRENEILHMGVVKDQFVEYKIGLDSLFTNNLVGTTMSNTFSLGTGGGYTQGSNSIFPILTPVSSGGIFMINREPRKSETLNITSDSYIQNKTAHTSVDLNTSMRTINYVPNHVYVNISIPSSVSVNATGNYGLTVNNLNTPKWIAIVNLTPQMTYALNYSYKSGADCFVFSPDGPNVSLSSTSCLYPGNQSKYTGTDLTITISNGNILTMQNFPVYRNVVSGGKYTIDLMDSSYGLNPVTLPGDSLKLVVDRPMGSITGTGNISYDFAENSNYQKSIQLGAIEYRADNNYWIPQTYYYQMGGVFLSQSDGSTTYKLPPEISFSKNLSNIITVNINSLAITNPGGGSTVGGNSPVQIKTALVSNTALPYAVGTANTKSIRIGVTTSDDQARVMWKNYFNYTAKAALLPSNSFATGNTTTMSYIDIYGFDLSPTGAFDINVIASDATYSSTVYGVG